MGKQAVTGLKTVHLETFFELEEGYKSDTELK